MYKRLLLMLAAATVVAISSKPACAQDEIRFLNNKNQQEGIQVTIKEESPAGIVYKLSSGRTEKLAARDIIDITYQVPQAFRLDYRGLGGKEREADQPGTKPDKRLKLLQEPQKQYQKLVPKLSDNKLAQRHAQFKSAVLLARLA